jgi:ribosomal protein L39E
LIIGSDFKMIMGRNNLIGRGEKMDKRKKGNNKVPN